VWQTIYTALRYTIYLQDLQVMKVKVLDGAKTADEDEIANQAVCLVVTLNHTSNALPEDLLNATIPVTKEIVVILHSRL